MENFIMYHGFSLDLLKLICCPNDADMLIFEGERLGVLARSGILRCNYCGVSYPIEEGILNLLTHQSSIDPVSAFEIEARNIDAENYHKYCTEIANSKEIPSTLTMMGSLKEKKVVELGCGTGRYSLRIVEQAAEFIGVDFSIDSLRLLARSMPDRGLTGLVLADASKFKTVADHFDLVFSAQVLQHLPSISIRDELYRNVVTQLRSGGKFACNAYYYHLIWRLHGMPQKGYHDSGIYFHRFTRRELTSEIGRHLKVRAAHPISIHIPFTRRLRINDVWLSRKLEKVPLINTLGEFMLVKAEKLNTGTAAPNLAVSHLEEV